MAGSGLSLYVANSLYSYINEKNIGVDVVVDETSMPDIEPKDYSIEFCLLDDNLVERVVSSNKSINNIGVTVRDKMKSLQKLIHEECGRLYHINNTKKIKNRWLRLIKEYETYGHDEFIYRHNKNSSKPSL